MDSEPHDFSDGQSLASLDAVIDRIFDEPDEYAVNLFDGAYGPGEGHAPMVYAGDPRQDVPSALRTHRAEPPAGRVHR